MLFVPNQKCTKSFKVHKQGLKKILCKLQESLLFSWNLVFKLVKKPVICYMLLFCCLIQSGNKSIVFCVTGIVWNLIYDYSPPAIFNLMSPSHGSFKFF